MCLYVISIFKIYYKIILKTNLFYISSLFLRVCIFLYVFYPAVPIKHNNISHIYYVFYPAILTRHIDKHQERVDELTENRDLSREMLSELQHYISSSSSPYKWLGPLFTEKENKEIEEWRVAGNHFSPHKTITRIETSTYDQQTPPSPPPSLLILMTSL
jgi:hypothetical protein